MSLRLAMVLSLPIEREMKGRGKSPKRVYVFASGIVRARTFVKSFSEEKYIFRNFHQAAKHDFLHPFPTHFIANTFAH